ncbi:MAG: glutamate formimidoyltransferase [Thermovirgaceae bacterium]|jgi:glutamate formiminotransferase|nr:glutamate formimidoyltransferase [Synergistales bacterium]MDI9391985.1 glutamate formimidoyltransferase [Synergistota bacterium]MDY0178336.1 glutamate formimidoyltransferase [Synergistaceae bacterium]HRW87967.1 glutamate formimidoyltransferase [Thermovirgaceae bacterium]MDD3133315.1 glutamate formimidoyltransferase [Synergistales bacterium]
MIMRIVECVPNFSEGRRKDVIESIVAPLRDRKGCQLLDHRSDENHNRLVVSLAGDPEAIMDSLIRSAEAAFSLIDMNVHSGAHPRIGALDVVPFTPLKGLSMEECVQIAREFGRRLNEQFKVPVYYYEEAATRPDRKNLENIRKGQFEGLKKAIGDPERHPDVGEAKMHPTAGATVVGARKFLVAFNVNLGTCRIEIAKEIARSIRFSGGGLAHVKAIGLALEEKGMVQVSVNIVDHEKNPLYRVLELVRMEASRWGVPVVETEIYGMVPASAIFQSAAHYLQAAGLEPEQIIELKLLDMSGEQS